MKFSKISLLHLLLNSLYLGYFTKFTIVDACLVGDYNDAHGYPIGPSSLLLGPPKTPKGPLNSLLL